MKLKISAVLAGYGVFFIISMAKPLATMLMVYTMSNNPASWTQSSYMFTFYSYLVQFIACFSGGFVAAWLARRDELFHGFALSLLSFFIGLIISFIVFYFRKYEMEFNVMMIVSFITTTLFYLSGAYVRSVIHKKSDDEKEIPFEQKINELGKNEADPQ